MFQDSLLESGGRFRTRRGLTTAVSVGLQLLGVGLLVLVPLLYTEALPRTQLAGLLVAPSPPPAAPPETAEHRVRPSQPGESDKRGLRQPTRIPPRVNIIVDDSPPLSGHGIGVIASTGSGESGDPNTVITQLLNTLPRPALVSRPAMRPVISTGVSEGLLVRKVQPLYPRTAIAARIQGRVVLQAVIGRDGTIQNLRVVSGNPLLAPAAVEAVRQWRYRPYLLNGQPVEVETQVEVGFVLVP